MSALELFLLIAVFSISGYTAYTDTKSCKISNLCTYGLALAGALSQAIFVYLGLLTLPQYLWLILGGLAIAFLLFTLGIWSPGDAKLFWAVSVALPPALLTGARWNYAPFVILINTFIPYFCAMVLIILFRTTARQKLQTLRSMLAPSFLLRYAFSLLAFGSIALWVNRWLPIRLDYFGSVCLFIVLYSLFDRAVTKRWQPFVLAPIALVSLILVGNALPNYLVLLATTGLLFLVLRFFLASLGDHLFVSEIAVQDLRKGHVPAHIIVRDSTGRYRPHEVAFTSFVALAARPRDTEVVMEMAPQGLSASQVAELRQLADAGQFANFDNRVKVQTTMPFAPLILLGVILTVSGRGLIVEAIINWLR